MAIIHHHATDTSLVRQFELAIGSLPGLTDLHWSASTPSRKRVLFARMKSKPVQLQVDIKQSVYPRDALLLATRDNETGTVPVVIAHTVSPGAREVLRRHRIGYWDEGGSLYLELANGLFFIEKETPRIERSLRNVFHGSTAQVLHALLQQPERVWHLGELAEIAEVSAYTVQHTFAWLESQLWMEKRGTGPATVRRLVEPGALLDAWASEHSLKAYQFHRYFHLARSRGALEGAVASLLTRLEVVHGWTLDSGAELVAPMKTGTLRASVLIPRSAVEALDKAAQASGFQPVADGENVAFLAVAERAPLMFVRPIKELQVVSNVQLYLDLWASPQRGKDQARHLRASQMEF